jgi:hypothetical protein
MKKIYNYFCEKSIKHKILLGIFSLVLAKSIFIFPFKPISSLWGVLLGFFIICAIYFLLIIIIFLLNKVSWELKPTKIPWYNLLLYMIPSIAIYSFLLAVVFPGIVPYDSMYIWDMTITQEFNNLHPLVYTLYVNILNSIIDSPWLIVAIQILYTSFAFSMIATTFERLGLKKTWCWVIVIILTIYPVNAITTVTMLKDVNYMVSLMLISSVFIRIVVDRKLGWLNLISMFAFSLFALFSRHNALLTITLVYIIFALYYFVQNNKKFALKIVALFLAILSVFFATNKTIEAILGESYWKRSSLLDMAMMPSAQLSFTVDQNWYELTDEQMATADTYLDLGYVSETVKKRSTWKFSHIYVFSLKPKVIKNDIRGFAKFYFGFWRDYPLDMILAYQQMTGIAWAIPNYGYTLPWNTGISAYDKDIGISSQSLFPEINKMIKQYPEVMFYLRPALYLMLSILMFFAFSKRHGFALILISSPMLANAAGYFIGTPAQNVRYLYCNFTITIILIVFSFLMPKTIKD